MSDSLPMIYSEVPTLRCARKCQAACGPILAYPYEVREFERKSGKPFPDALNTLEGDYTCPLLGLDGACSVYRDRPLICRLWGVVDVDGMRCPHGCKPDRWLSNTQARELLERARALGEVAHA